MKQYVEATQIVDEGITPDWCRLEIEGDTDLAEGIAQVDAIMVDSKPYVMKRHYCRHDTRGGCDMTEIKVVR